MFFRQIFDADLAQYAYLIGCQRTGEAIVVDPERDVDRYVELAAQEGLRLVATAETHIHADFLSGSRELVERHGAVAYLSAEGGSDWSYGWADEGDDRVRFLRDGDTFEIGAIEFTAVHTPGHTPEHIAFLVTDRGGGANGPMGIASGDFVFVGDLGRPDLLETAAGEIGAREPSARLLFGSTRRFLELADHVQVWPGHGAGSACGKALGAVPQSTVGYERRFNAALAFDTEERFVDAILDGQPEPPLYFARMKRLNRDGVPRLGTLPSPSHVSVADLATGKASGVVIDTRADRDAFMRGHLPRSIYAPLGVSFAMVVGSYVDPDAEIHLVIDPDEVERAIRTLVRIGYDRVVGWITPEELVGHPDLVATASAETSDFDPAAYPGAAILDVRGAAEFDEAHLPGALNIAHTRLAERLDELDRARPVVVHCRSGARASSASSFLEKEGYDVTFLDGLFSDFPEMSPTPTG